MSLLTLLPSFCIHESTHNLLHFSQCKQKGPTSFHLYPVTPAKIGFVSSSATMSFPSGFPSREEFLKRSLEFWQPKIEQMVVSNNDAYYDSMYKFFHPHGSPEPLNLTTNEKGAVTEITEEDQSLNSCSDELINTTVVQQATASPNQHQTAINFSDDDNLQCLNSIVSPTAHAETEIESSVPLLSQNSSQSVQSLPKTTANCTIVLKSTQQESDSNAATVEKVVSFNNPITSPAEIIHIDDFFEEVEPPPSIEEMSIESNYLHDSYDCSQEVTKEPSEQEIDNDENNYEVVDQLKSVESKTSAQTVVEEESSVVEDNEQDIESYIEEEEEGIEDLAPPRKKMKTCSAIVLPDSPDSEPANDDSRPPLLSPVRESFFRINENSAFDVVISQINRSPAPISDQNETISEKKQKTLKRRHSSHISSQQNIKPKASTSVDTSNVSTEDRSSDLLNFDETACHSRNSLNIKPDKQVLKRATFSKEVQQNKIKSISSKAASKSSDTAPREDVLNFINEAPWPVDREVEAVVESKQGHLEANETEISDDWYGSSSNRFNDIKIIEMKCHEESCKDMFRNQNDHKKHMKDAHNRNPFPCQLCYGTFLDKQLLINHVNAVHPNSECKCRICGIKAKNERMLYGHYIFMHQIGKYTCTDDNCLFESNLRTTVSKHNDTKHSKIAQSSTEKIVRRQVSTEGSPLISTNALICMICAEQVNSMNKLFEHNEKMHDKKRYICFVKNCPESFNHLDDLRNNHVTSEHNPPFYCSHCSYVFNTYNELFNHVRWNHQKGEFACLQNDCRLIFPTRALASAHQKDHNAQSYIVKKLYCPIKGCKKEFPFEEKETSFLNHLKEEHKRKKFFCLHEDCEHSSDQIKEIEDHARSKHSPKNKWKCPLCPYENKRYSPLNIHYKREHFPGLFICKICEFAGKYRASVSDHYDSVHNDIMIADNRVNLPTPPYPE